MSNLTGTEVIEIMNDWITEKEENGITAVSLEELDMKIDSIPDISESDISDDDECGELSEKLDDVSEKLTELLEVLADIK